MLTKIRAFRASHHCKRLRCRLRQICYKTGSCWWGKKTGFNEVIFENGAVLQPVFSFVCFVNPVAGF